MEAHPRCTHAAILLFDKGLLFRDVVRGLVEQLGLSEADALRAAQTAVAERILAQTPAQPGS